MKKIYEYRLAIWLVLAFAVAFAAGQVYLNYTKVPTTEFSSAEYGLSFSYPVNYQLAESESATGHIITLADKAALAATPENGEGPTTMSVKIFPNTKKLTPAEWAQADKESNYHLSPYSTLASSTLSGSEAVAYIWDGLYRGESYVFAHNNTIEMFTVTYLNPNDRIKKDFDSLLRSVSFK